MRNSGTPHGTPPNEADEKLVQPQYAPSVMPSMSKVRPAPRLTTPGKSIFLASRTLDSRM